MILANLPKGAHKTGKKIPDYLVRETLNGKRLYYKGYREVLTGNKTFSEIMGSSSLQSLLVTHLIILLGKTLDETKYTILSSEAGLHLGKNNNLAGDILIFENTALPIQSINEQYASVAPKVVIEVDITIDSPEMQADHYLHEKTQKLLDFGVEKVIWILTPSKKVMVATQAADWQTQNWSKDVEILDGIIFNLGSYLTKKGSAFA